MAKNRDLSKLLGDNTNGIIDNSKITLDANEIPNLDTAKITSGSFADARIPNLAASKITSGTFADARIAASNVSQHATSFDDNKIVNDISTLGLRVHSQENLNASNSNSSSFDVFQDSSAISNLTNVSRNASEYMSSVQVSQITDFNYTMEHTSGSNNTGIGTPTNDVSGSYTRTTRAKFGNRSLYGMDSINPMFKWTDSSGYTGDFTFQVWFHTNGISDNSYYPGWLLNFGTSANQISSYKWRSGFGSGYWVLYRDGGNNAFANNGSSSWFHHAVARQGNTMSIWSDGTRQHTWTQNASSEPLKEIILGGTNGAIHHSDTNIISKFYYDGFVFDRGIRSGFEPSNSTISLPTSQPSNITVDNTSATGSFTGNNITASSTNKMGAVITYQDNAGTNALNTDIVLQLSADGGSNFSTATMTALPDFATGIKMAKVNDLAVTAGTSLKYKISFANQASGSKEARIRGVSLQY